MILRTSSFSDPEENRDIFFADVEHGRTLDKQTKRFT